MDFRRKLTTMNGTILFAVAAGGAVGAVLRYLVTSSVEHLMGSSFPWGTFVVNFAGSVILAALIETMALKWSPAPELRAALVAGVLSAFTTFSTFSLDAYTLYERGQLAAAGVYVLGSVVLCVLGIWAGLKVMRMMLA